MEDDADDDGGTGVNVGAVSRRPAHEPADSQPHARRRMSADMDEDSQLQDASGNAAGAAGAGLHARPGSASASAVRRALLASPPPPPLAQAPTSAFAGGVVVCPICKSAAFQTGGGLVRHITAMHTGESLSEGSVDVLRRLDRAVCTEVQCGGLNRVGLRRQCNRCGRAANLRPLQAGDVVPGPRVTPAMPLLQRLRQKTKAGRRPVRQ